MLGCGVPERYYDAQVEAGVKKGVYVRAVIEALSGKGKPGHEVLNRIAVELSKLNGPVHPDKLDAEVAKQCLGELRLLVGQAGLRSDIKAHPPAPATTASSPAEREAKLQQVKERFYELDQRWSGTAQSRGYAFQDLLKDLFGAYGIPYTPPFRDVGQELDGMFNFEGRRFLMEARWRKDEANFAALSHFHSKIVTKFSGTVGVFISMEGFAEDAVASLSKLGESRFLLLPGFEFVKIIEQTVSLPDALAQMLDEAHKHGVITVRLRV